MRYAFKEWAVVCRALTEGHQSMIIRKGGIAEDGGEFKPDHARFWLFPTYVHQKADSLKPAYSAWLPSVPPVLQPGELLSLTHYVEVPTAYRVPRLDLAEELDALHIWSPATIRQRFDYRTPGLFVLPTRVYRAVSPRTITVLPEYEGCKTWVDLQEDIDVAGVPILNDRDFADRLEAIENVLFPNIRV